MSMSVFHGVSSEGKCACLFSACHGGLSRLSCSMASLARQGGVQLQGRPKMCAIATDDPHNVAM